MDKYFLLGQFCGLPKCPTDLSIGHQSVQLTLLGLDFWFFLLNSICSLSAAPCNHVPTQPSCSQAFVAGSTLWGTQAKTPACVHFSASLSSVHWCKSEDSRYKCTYDVSMTTRGRILSVGLGSLMLRNELGLKWCTEVGNRVWNIACLLPSLEENLGFYSSCPREAFYYPW